MDIDWLVIWGVAQATGALVRPVLEDLANDVAKDSAMDYVKSCFGNVFKPLQKDLYQRALGKSLKELAQLIDAELCDAGVPESQTEAWSGDVKMFFRTEAVQQALRQAFEASNSTVDGALLKQGWRQLPEPSPPPPDFDWDYVAKTFSRRLRTLREEDNDLRQILQTQAAVETATNTRQSAGLPPEFNLEGYRESLLEYHGNLKLELLDATGSGYRVKLWSIFVPQTVRDCQGYIPQLLEMPKEHQLRLRQRGDIQEADFNLTEEILEQRRQIYQDQSPRPVLEVVGDDRIEHLVILGDPGSGKSTLLKALALEWAQTEPASERNDRTLPLLIELGAYDRWKCPSGKSFIRYLQDAQTVHRLEQFRLDEQLRRRGGSILLLDGLDEIFDQNSRKDALNDIHRFSNEYPETRIVVTSRWIGYDQRQLTDAGFHHFMLQDLDDAQIKEFLDRWYDTFTTDMCDRMAKKERLSRAIGDSRAIRELAENPLLLTMMSILNLHQELPRDRVKLYERATEVLLHHWDFERLGLKGSVEYREKAEMLRRLADHMQNASAGLKGNIVAGDDLKRIFRDYLKNELELPNAYQVTNELVEQLRGRNFILCHLGADNYAFVHRTLLEYFCASALVRRALREESSLEFLKTSVFGLHWKDETWHEVLRLIAGMDDQVPGEHVATIVDFLLIEQDRGFEFQNIFVAANCCLEVRNPKSLGQSRTRAKNALLQLTRFDFPYFYKEYQEEAQRRNDICKKAISSLANPQLFDEAHGWLKDRAAKDDNWAVRQAAVQELARGWKDDPDTLKLLKDCAITNKNPGVRSTIISWLDRCFGNDVHVQEFLQNCAVNDLHREVRGTAMEAIAQYISNDPKTLQLLCERAVNDPHPYVRQAASQSLAKFIYKDVESLSTLESVIRDQQSNLCSVAVWAIALNLRQDEGALPLLQNLATTDTREDVRRMSVKALAKFFQSDKQTFLLMSDRAVNDCHQDVRDAAVWAVAMHFTKKDQTLPLLRDRSLNDPDENVRNSTIHALVRYYRDDEQTLLLLRDLAVKDKSPLADALDYEYDQTVRDAALRAIAQYWPEHPETLPLLHERAEKDPTPWLRVKAKELADEIKSRGKP